MEYNATQFDIHAYIREIFIVSTIHLLICLPGLVGNGIVIYLLGFHIKRNSFTTYILNLSVADFGLLTEVVMRNIFLILDLVSEISFMLYLDFLHYSIFLFTFFTSQFLLIIISIDRCMCLFFPLWHRCHWPPHLSTAVCAVIWILNFLITVTDLFLRVTIKYYAIRGLQYYFCTVIFMPIMCVPTIAMLIKICLRSQRKKWGKLLRAILLKLVFFFFFVFPINIIYFISIIQKAYEHLFFYSSICAALNSTINPMIYYLVGRDKMRRSSKRIDKILEELFKEDEVYREEQETSAEVQL